MSIPPNDTATAPEAPVKTAEKGLAALLRRIRPDKAREATHAPLDQQPLKTANVNERFSDDDAERMAAPHAPECMMICCLDSRIQPSKALDYGPGKALEYRPISCVIPPAYKADPDLKSRMAFRRMKEISTIVLMCHSDCGGAQAALAMPAPDPESEDDLHTVASFVQRSGLDIPLLAKGFLAQEGGNIRRAGDRLAREIGVKSLQNLMGYKGATGYETIADEVAVGALSVRLFYLDLEKRQLEMYDMKTGAWAHTIECDVLRLENGEGMQPTPGLRPAVSLKKPYEILAQQMKEGAA